MTTYTVQPGQQVQPVLEACQPGDTVQLAPGTYHERLTLTVPGVTLQGAGAVLHGGEPVAGWEPAPEVDDLVWKTTSIPYECAALTLEACGIWRINDDTMHGGEVYGCVGDGFYYLSRPAEGAYTGGLGSIVQSYWDGIEALYGVRSGVTYVRFRHGEDPNVLGLTSAPPGAVVLIDNVPGVTLEGLRILGGETQVEVRGAAATGTTITRCTLLTGRRRVRVTDDASATRVTHCDLSSQAVGLVQVPPGEWQRDGEEYALVVRTHQYHENKFLCGRTTEDDTNIHVNHALDTRIEDCTLHGSLVGVSLDAGVGTVIAHCTVSGHGAQGIWLLPAHQRVEIGDNLFYDCEHCIRIQSLQDTRKRCAYIYHNQFWQPRPTSDSPKHINMSFEGVDGQEVEAAMELWVYHNTFTGGGWAVDGGGSGWDLPQLYHVNNLFSNRGISARGGTGVSVFAANWLVGPGGYPNREDGNVIGDGTRLWEDETMPDFVIPDSPLGETAQHGALDVSQPFTIAGVTYAPLPGCAVPQAAFGARTTEAPEPPQPPGGVDKAVAAEIHDLAPGTYTVRVQLLQETTVVVENVSVPFTVAQSTPAPQMTVPVVTDLEATP